MTPPPSERRLVALITLAGVAVFLAGAAVGAALGVWGAEGDDELLRLVANSPGLWRAAIVLLAAGTAVAAAGTTAFALLLWRSATNAWAGAAAALVVCAGALGVLDFAVAGEGISLAADEWAVSGQVPTGYEQLEQLEEAVGKASQLLAYGAVAALGLAILRTSWLPRALGGAGVVLGTGATLASLVAVDLIPAVAEFLFAMYAGALLLQREIKASNGTPGPA